MKATVQLDRGPNAEIGSMPRTYDVECAVRLGMQGYGSVEIDCTPLPVLLSDLRWMTLEAVLGNPQVLGVTFRGPWTDSHALDAEKAEASGWQSMSLPPGADRKPLVR